MENTYQYRPKRPTSLSVFIVLALICYSIILLKSLSIGIDEVPAIILGAQIYGLIRLWKLEDIGVYLWFVPQCIVLIILARQPIPGPFIVDAVITVIFIYCIGPVWNSLH